MPIKLLTAPRVEPMSLAEAKLYIKQDIDEDDALISALIIAVREYAHTRTQYQIVSARYQLVMDSFPGPSLMGVPYGVGFTLPGDAILIHKAPLIQVVQIRYQDMSSNWQVLDPTTYVVDDSCSPARITPIFGSIWPPVLPQIGSVQVTFDVGAVCSATFAGNNMTLFGWPQLDIDDPVYLSNSGGALPAGLTAGSVYYVLTSPSANVYTLSATPGGAPIELSDTGSGITYFSATGENIPQGLLAWMKVRLGSMDQFRAEVEVVNKGKLEALGPLFIDNLLDGYRLVLP